MIPVLGNLTYKKNNRNSGGGGGVIPPSVTLVFLASIPPCFCWSFCLPIKQYQGQWSGERGGGIGLWPRHPEHALSISHTLTRPLSPSHTLSHSFSVSHTHSRSLILCLSPSISLSVFHPPSHSASPPVSLCLSDPVSHLSSHPLFHCVSARTNSVVALLSSFICFFLAHHLFFVISTFIIF